MARMGRPSLFGPKDTKARYQGLMTKAGSKLFEQARKDLAAMAQIAVASVSDGDVFEYLARGPVASREALQKTRT